MNKSLFLLFFSFLSFNCLAIDYYKPGDTLWVWAKNGLNIREAPNPHSKILGKAENGDLVISIDFINREFPFSIEEIKKSSHIISENEPVACPNYELTGYWAKIDYKGKVGYVFDAYLSKQPTIIGHQFDQKRTEDFHVLSLKKHAKIIKKISENNLDNKEYYFERYIFENGDIINLSGGSGHWEKGLLFSNSLSILEGYLIYATTMKLESDILVEKGEDFLKFKVDTGFLTIKKVGYFLVIYEEHAC